MKKASLSRKTNRTSNPDSLIQNRRLPRLRWILPFAGFVILAVGVGVWALAQPFSPAAPPAQDPIKARLGEPDESPEKRMERELDRLAILDPVEFGKEIDKHKTPADFQAEEAARFAILQPGAYSAAFEKTRSAERKEQERQVRAAILNPLQHSGPIQKQKKDPAKKPPQP